MLVWITSGKEKGGSVLKSIYKLSGFIAVLAWSGMVSATGLGGINVSSSLGQPLKAEIELVSVDKADSSSISAKLASPDAFKSAGVDYPYSLPKLKFEVINRDSGSPSIKLTTAQPVNDPFVTLLVEVTWSSGKLLREYTFLLDPVDFKIQEPQSVPVQTIAPVVAAPVAPEAPVAVAPAPVVTQPATVAPTVAQPEQAVAPAPVDGAQQVPVQPEAAVPATPAPAEEPAPAPVQATPTEASPTPVADALSKEEAIPVVEPEAKPLTVVRGDTLSKIALKNKPADVSLERMLVALYRANSDAFVSKNMNRLKTGKIIRLPDTNDLDAVQQAEAVKEVRAQVADWNVYRQQLAAAKTEVASDTTTQVSSGKINTAVAESTASKAPAKEVLKLSKGEAPGDKAVGGGKASAQEKANAKEEETIAKNKALKEAQDRTALLEKNVKDLQRLAELKKQAEVASASAASAPAVAASAPAVVKPKVAVPEPTVVEQASLLDDPIMLAAGVAGLLALGGVGFMLTRRNKKSGGDAKADEEKSVTEDIGGATGRIAAPVVPSPDTGDFTQSANQESTTQISSDEVDPIGEADLFLTFGRDVQAEEVLVEALKSNPNNVPVRLKLLSIYSTRKDTNSFFTHAKVIKESGDEAAWSQAAAMGLALEPSNPLYGGDGAAAAPAVEQPSEAVQPSVDFDLGFGSTSVSESVQAAPDFQGTVVIEPPSNESTTILSSSDLRAAQETPMDFDVTGTHPGIPAIEAEAKAETEASSPVVNLDEMVFDVTSTHPGIPAQSAAPSDADTPAENVDDLIFDLTATHVSTPAVEKPVAAPADDGGLAFTLDFPTDFKAPASAKEPAPVDIGLGDISLNLDSLTPDAPAPATSENRDERWQEVATKLDLAKAYQEMGDAAGAKEILEEVLRDGDDEQRASAEAMMQQL
jgi:pilus assembly protein FimV